MLDIRPVEKIWNRWIDKGLIYDFGFTINEHNRKSTIVNRPLAIV